MDDHERCGRGPRSLWEKYETFASPAAERIRRAALGTEVANGYTTQAQAEEIATALALSRDQPLLDLGSGRGWPGSHVAKRTGCRLVVCDLPMNALRTATTLLRTAGLDGPTSVVRADGRSLPFADASFDGVSHTDVLC